MAKIENIIVYPTVTPAASDLLIATDVSDNNKTVTFLVSSLAGGGGVLQDLQSVLTTGDTAIEDINLTGNITVIGTVAPTTITALGSPGAAGQILSSTGAGLQWINSPSTSCCTWNDSLISGNISTTKAVVDGVAMDFINAGGELNISTPATLSNSGTSAFSGVVSIVGTEVNFNTTGQINDSAGSIGIAGQWLISQGPGLGVEWSSTLPPASCCNLQQTLDIGNSALNVGMTFTGTSVISLAAGVSIDSDGSNVWAGNNTFSATGNLSTTAGIALTGTLWDGTSIGSAGQVLTSTGAGVAWAAAGGGGGGDLQSVLDIGNSASGVNANITLTGASAFIDPVNIIDFSGSDGALNQVLSIGALGLTWIDNVCCNLQDTLDAGNSANQNITLTTAGNTITTPIIVPGLIEDGAGSTGLANEILSMNGAGTALEWGTGGGFAVTQVNAIAPGTSAGAAIVITPNIGIVEVQSMAYAGDTDVGHVPVGGNKDVDLYLNGNGLWSYPINVGTFLVAAPVDSTGLPLTAVVAANTATLTARRFKGAALEGFVPDSSASDQTTTFLRADGTWTIPGGGAAAVTSVNPNPVLGTSTGVPLKTLPTTGAVLIESLAYDGDTKVGHVPSGGLGNIGLYLNGDGGWTVPTAISPTSDQFIRLDFGATGLDYTKNEWMTYTAFNGGGATANPSGSHQVTEQNIGTYNAVGFSFSGLTTEGQHMNAVTIANPGSGGCGSLNQMKLCAATITLMANVTPTGVGPPIDIIRVSLFKTRTCEDGLLSYTEAAFCDMELTGPEDMVCCETLSIASQPLGHIALGEAYMLAWKCEAESYIALDIQGTVHLRVRHEIPAVP